MSIYDYYKKPSMRKKEVFEYWKNYALFNGYVFNVKSATKCQISFVLWNEKVTMIVSKSYISKYETHTGKFISKTINNDF